MIIRLGLSFTRAELRTMLAVLDAPGDSFVALARTAGLDITRDFRRSDLRNVDFGEDDISGLDISGADVTGADFSRARGCDRVIVDGDTLLSPGALPPPSDFDDREVKRLILAGQRPPAHWRPFITELDLNRTQVAELAPLAGLTALQTLHLNRTQVAELAPLAGLTQLETLDLRHTRARNVAVLPAHLLRQGRARVFKSQQQIDEETKYARPRRRR